MRNSGRLMCVLFMGWLSVSDTDCFLEGPVDSIHCTKSV